MPTILVVEDDPDITGMLEGLLQISGYQVLLAPNGAVALTKLPEQPVDLVLSDLRMPTMDGMQLYEMIRANPDYQTIPFILVTASTFSQLLPPDSCATILKKPFHPRTLLATITELLDE